jgi:hypothetical protein
LPEGRGVVARRNVRHDNVVPGLEEPGCKPGADEAATAEESDFNGRGQRSVIGGQ